MERWHGLETERREQILGAALAEFGERGWDGASMQRIADGAGLSKGLLYYYFEGRESLFAWCLLQFLDELERYHGGWPALDDPDTFWGDLEAFWNRVMTLALDRPELMCAMRSFMRDVRFLDMGAPFTLLQERMDSFQALIVRQGQAFGLIREDIPVDLLMMLVSSHDEALDKWTFSQRTIEPEHLRAASSYRIDFMRRLLSPA
jgi:AcrR family transcriptional regulator